MATPWLDAPAAWIDGTAGFGSGDVAAETTVCRAGLAGQAVMVAGIVACQVVRSGATAVQADWRASAAGLAARQEVVCRVGDTHGWPQVAAEAGWDGIALRCGTAGVTVAGQALPPACRLVLVAGSVLAATGLREVARLFSPIAVGCRLASPVTPAVFLASRVEIEQT